MRTGSQCRAMAKSFGVHGGGGGEIFLFFMMIHGPTVHDIKEPPSCSNLWLVSKKHHQKATLIIIQCSH